MNNIVRIFKNDVRRVRGSVIGIVVTVGLVIVPVLYAWFNIGGSWDPYGNTGNLKVAVANSDAGYMSDLVPIKVNLGETVMSSLRENDQLAWQFVSEDDAVEGVKSGAYYAAVVIPKDFSASMMTLFSSDVEHAQIEYYENQKASAIAPRVTDKAAGTVRQQVDEVFTKTLGSVGLTVASELSDMLDSDQVTQLATHMAETLDGVSASVGSAAETVGACTGVLDSATGLLQSTGDMLSEAGKMGASSQGLVDDARQGLGALNESVASAVAAVEQAIKDGAGHYDAVEQAMDNAFATVGGHVDATVEQLGTASTSIAEKATSMREVQHQLVALKDEVKASDLPSVVKDDLVQKIDTAQNGAGNIANQQELLAGHLSDAASTIDTRMGEARAQLEEARALIEQARADVQQVKGTYDEELKAELDALAKAMGTVSDDGAQIGEGLDQVASDLAATASSLAGDFGSARTSLSDAAASLESSAGTLAELKEKLAAAAAAGDAAAVRELLGSDPQSVASALAAPVTLDRRPVYHIDTYGSAMTPFYTTLSLWVGGIVLAAMLKAQVDEGTVRSCAPVRLHELYLGRYAFFALLAFAQATLVCAGDLLFFGIQCVHPLQFMLVGWVVGFVFSNIIYTLTVSFGDVGKALAVVLLVMQVAGSGGTFPIEMTAPFFQAVYPLLPFTHAINAMHAAMAGAYGMEYWAELGLLASYLIPSLALGLVFRRPVIRANEWVAEKLEETHLM